MTTSTIETIELQPLSDSTFPHSTISKIEFTRTQDRIRNDDTPNLDNGLGDSSPEIPPLSTLSLTMTILQPSLINFFGSFASGIITVGLPLIAASISLDRALYLWPTSVYSLTSGATLLIAGCITDIVGARRVEVAGIFLLGLFILVCGFAQTGTQLVVFRALQGVGLAMHIPASVSLLAGGIPAGRARNIGFSFLGLSQPLGFSAGMVCGGIMFESVGWRFGFYLSGGVMLATAGLSYFTLPTIEAGELTLGDTLKKLGTEVDWVGGTIAGGGLALLSYVLAIISANLYTIRSPTTASLLAVSIVLLIAFPIWMHHRERNAKSTLIPNSLWKSRPFSCICAVIAFSQGATTALTVFSSLYFQEVQHHSALISSFYLLPNLLVGVFIGLSVGIFVDRIPSGWLVVVSSLLAAVAPLMMAVVNPTWKYYHLELWAQILAPVSADVLYTVGLIIVSDSFPKKTKALAGAVFSTVGQFGTSLGVGVCQVVALGVMGPKAGPSSEGGDGNIATVGELLQGYRAAFWTIFTCMVCALLIAVGGLRKSGRVGLKTD
ncbi:major facilitator superfamily domain-containing protein [Phaeosphaeria sp. MPI-PUGE-AT-0046c]|nr:major facilitator superfamily domain-containing protein [Phaeosphaeria sp. MPI-PUGE-AT-0046c]